MSPGRWVSGFAGGAALYPSHIPAVRAALRPWQDKEDYWKPIFARRDFAVPSRTRVAGLQLRADDGPLAAGTGPLVTGSTLALVMSMAGRVLYLAELDGPGVPTLRSRLRESAS